MKKFLSIFMCLTLLFSFSAQPVAAATEIPVYLNGQRLVYTKPIPYIINGSTYVPLNKTAEYLGMTYSWDNATSTSTYIIGDRVAKHRILTNYVTVNGEVIQFDNPSKMDSGYAIMPVRMVAAMTGADVTWNATTRTVHVTSGANYNKPEPKSIQAVYSSIEVGKENTISVRTNNNATYVRIYNTLGASIGESSSFSTEGNERIFILKWTPTSSDGNVVNLSARAGNTSGLNNDKQVTTTCYVTQILAHTISSVIPKTDDADVDETITFEVKTPSHTVYVRVEDSLEKINKVYSLTSTNSTGNTFKIPIKFTKDGVHKVHFYPGGNGGFSTTATTSEIDVNGSSDELEIVSVAYKPNPVALDDETVVTVKTSTNVTRVRIYDYDNEIAATETKPDSKTSSQYTFKLDVTADKLGSSRYQVRIYDKDGEYISKNFYLECTKDGSSASGDIEILDFYLSDEYGDEVTSKVYADDEIYFAVEFTAYEKPTVTLYEGTTSKNTDEIDELKYKDRYKQSGDDYVFLFKGNYAPNVTKDTTYYYKVVVSTDDGEVSKTINFKVYAD